MIGQPAEMERNKMLPIKPNKNGFQSRSILESIAFRFTLFGIVFGFLFPLIATGIRIANLSLQLNLANVIAAQRSEPLLWIIDTAPIFLGLFAFLAGYREESLYKVNKELEARRDELEQLRVTLEQGVEA